MKFLKKSLRMLIVVSLMVMVLAPKVAASQPHVTPRTLGILRATTASMTNGQSNNVVARLSVHGGANGTINLTLSTVPTKISATTSWFNPSGIQVSHQGWIA